MSNKTYLNDHGEVFLGSNFTHKTLLTQGEWCEKNGVSVWASVMATDKVSRNATENAKAS